MVEHPDRRPIRVVIVEDHPMLVEMMQTRLKRAGIEVLGAAGAGGPVLGLLAEHRPDVLILDVRLPDMSGVEVARRVRTSFPEVAVLVLTGYQDLADQRALLRLGVRGYLHKTVSGAEFVAAVRMVARGRTVLWSREANATLDSQLERLTVREYQVLQLLASGARNSEIATALSLSEKTVELHVHHVLTKFGARSRAEAISKAYQQGLLSSLPNVSMAPDPWSDQGV